jgi:hypothetical protein
MFVARWGELLQASSYESFLQFLGIRIRKIRDSLISNV